MTILWPNGSTSRPPISSGFGPRNLDNPLASKYHRGVDMYDFDTVHAIADGTVVYVGLSSGVGWSAVAGFMVWVQHDGFFSRALHNDASTVRVRKGDRVRAGDPLVGMGWSGLQGPWATHVHLEVTPGQWHTANTGQVDPVPFIEARIGQTTGGGGVANQKGTDMEAYVTAPNGTVAHLRPSSKINFKDPAHYKRHRNAIRKLRRKKATDLMLPPTLGSVPKVSWTEFETIADAIGAPKG
ncbi:hypothetical protein GCM10010915_11720 [Microbacterium faecale]|uniref:M23ase beta-sheet core domain-containing protein n=1 Tax=Microbacterium faecale TaxID=1804630 RepID=A0A916Y6X5_9MICO|nr:M23 family metallopeptidase [Microbacterium faecale]GGD32989.1 hypothetical protein GCM10010915_11720 [Microbacterium faecale]